MKRTLLTIAIFAFATAFAVASFAQGRHDEKPHGSAKPVAGKSQAAGPIAGGRHDERPHGAMKSAPQKQEEPKSP